LASVLERWIARMRSSGSSMSVAKRVTVIVNALVDASPSVRSLTGVPAISERSGSAPSS
jgi:hypothetical protein